MIRGLTTAASGMTAAERMQQVLTNNLANTETPGFKASNAELLSFPEQLLHIMDYQGGNPALGPAIGTMPTGVTFQEGVLWFSQGDLVQTGRALDVAISDTTPAGPYAAVAAGPGGGAGAGGAPGLASVQGPVTTGAGGVLQVNGRPLAVVGANGQAIPGVMAIRNPAYQGVALTAADGTANYDAQGNPSYLFANAAGQVLGRPGQPGWEGASLRVGTEADMGWHSFFPVAFSSGQVAQGLVLTRDGHFDVDGNNILVDASGRPVLPVGADGLPILNGRIRINPNYTGTELFGPDGGPVVDAQGQASYSVIDTNGNVIAGRLGTVDADVTQLQPLGETEFEVGGTLNPAQVRALLRPGTGALKPGAEEQSNVDAAATMTKMMAVLAQYEANQRVIRTEDSLLQLAVEQVGKVNA
ncbi:flagellar hook-basal body protein [Alicyclobacillus macrosporangiidus]|uniref:Flagellar basal body rod protein FlgG n=1 Tax=Alicyclobacillus macrosporangiidus TaxID=392015 RepID=A0A1I7HYC4_9BACL|nr:flagellar basal body rod C-terminal domain-containing protein [Alicyclobacillus macrosporangiidus]SFU65704.1 Flagellar basal body rod protein FlgG [Alicyclobacillus macrosporangiidus]